jgi:hypothetical protein
MEIVIFIALIFFLLLPALLLWECVTLLAKKINIKEAYSTRVFYLLLVCQVAAIISCYYTGTNYFHTCSMCVGDGLFLFLTVGTSTFLLVTLSINFSISHEVKHPALTTLFNFTIIIPYYGFSIVATLTAYAFTIEPLFH